MCESHPGGTLFESVMESERAAEAWPCVAGLDSLQRVPERLLLEVQPSYNMVPSVYEDASTMARPLRTAAVMG